MTTNTLRYQSGFGNQFATEAVEGALPRGRNSPQQVAKGLYAELVSGSAFTAPRADNRRMWLYRRQPSVVSGGYEPFEQRYLKTGAKDGVPMPPNPLRWHPTPLPDAPQRFRRRPAHDRRQRRRRCADRHGRAPVPREPIDGSVAHSSTPTARC